MVAISEVQYDVAISKYIKSYEVEVASNPWTMLEWCYIMRYSTWNLDQRMHGKYPKQFQFKHFAYIFSDFIKLLYAEYNRSSTCDMPTINTLADGDQFETLFAGFARNGYEFLTIYENESDWNTGSIKFTHISTSEIEVSVIYCPIVLFFFYISSAITKPLFIYVFHIVHKARRGFFHLVQNSQCSESFRD